MERQPEEHEALTREQVAYVRNLMGTCDEQELRLAALDPLDSAVRVAVAKNPATPPAVLVVLATQDPNPLVRSVALTNKQTPLDALVRSLSSDDVFVKEQAKTTLHCDRFGEWLYYVEQQATMEELHRALYSGDPVIVATVEAVITTVRAEEWKAWKAEENLAALYDLSAVIPEEWFNAIFRDD